MKLLLAILASSSSSRGEKTIVCIFGEDFLLLLLPQPQQLAEVVASRSSKLNFRSILLPRCLGQQMAALLLTLSPPKLYYHCAYYYYHNLGRAHRCTQGRIEGPLGAAAAEKLAGLLLL